MNKVVKAGIGVGVVVALATFGSPAQANIGGSDYRDCTRVEFHAVQRGDSLTSVQRKLDGPGKISFKSGSYQSRQWGKGYQNGWCLISFHNKRVYDKSYIA